LIDAADLAVLELDAAEAVLEPPVAEAALALPEADAADAAEEAEPEADAALPLAVPEEAVATATTGPAPPITNVVEVPTLTVK